jgi:DNA-directed RNA polymerase specialized sigma24 family protein
MFEPPFSDYTDAELVGALRKDGFTGPKWERYREYLAGYGLKVLLAWLRSGEIVRRLRQRGIRCGCSSAIYGQDADDLASEAVAKAVEPFRVMLVDECWDPEGPASLKSAFITGCLLQFPNAYSRWARQARRTGRQEVLVGDEVITDWLEWQQGQRRDSPSGDSDPQTWVIDRQCRQELLALLPDDLRAVVQLSFATGWPFRRAAREHGHHPDKLWRRLQHELRRPGPQRWWQEWNGEPGP